MPHLIAPVTALLSIGASVILTMTAQAADPTPNSAALGPPTVLYSPTTIPLDPPAPTTPPARSPVAAQGKRPTAPAIRTVPVEAKPLIPPAQVAPKLGPPPDPRPALPLETDLQPLAPATQTPPAGSAPPAPRSPTG